MTSFEEALIKQQLEFTLSQLEECKQKEDSLKKTNDCLLKALSENSSSPLDVISNQAHAMSELQKRLEIQIQVNKELKAKIKELKIKAKQEKQELNLAMREIELTLKQQQLFFQGEKLNSLKTIQKLEAENSNLLNLAKITQKPEISQKTRIEGLNKSFAKEKEELLNETFKIREDYEHSFKELKAIYDNENFGLRKSIDELQSKLKNSLNIIEELKEKGSEMIESQTDELECQVEYFKELYLNAFKNNLSKVKFNDSCDRQKLENLIQKFELENSKLSLELEKNQFDAKRAKMDLLRFKGLYAENEKNLKNEIKILIGKLMKAKNKLGINEEFRESLKRDVLSNRSISSNKSRNNLSYY